MRVASLVIGDAIRRGGLALDGPVGAAILAHRPDAAGLVFQQGQMGAQGFGRRAGPRRVLQPPGGNPRPQLRAAALPGHGQAVDDGLLQYLSPLGWEHINLTGDYLWRSSAKIGAGKFRPLRPLQPA